MKDGRTHLAHNGLPACFGLVADDDEDVDVALGMPVAPRLRSEEQRSAHHVRVVAPDRFDERLEPRLLRRGPFARQRSDLCRDCRPALQTRPPSTAARWLAVVSSVIGSRFPLALSRTLPGGSAPIPSSRPRRLDPPGLKRCSVPMLPASDAWWEMMRAPTPRREFVVSVPALAGRVTRFSPRAQA